jgi:hypothetical protein
MKVFLCFIIFLQSGLVTSQADSLEMREFFYVKKLGVRYSFDNIGIVAYPPDTIITHNIRLEDNNIAVLKIDTLIGNGPGFGPELKWIGKWTQNADTLIVELSQHSTLWPFSLNGKPEPIIEELPSPIVKKFKINLDLNGTQISSLTEITNDTELIVFK